MLQNKSYNQQQKTKNKIILQKYYFATLNNVKFTTSIKINNIFCNNINKIICKI